LRGLGTIKLGLFQARGLLSQIQATQDFGASKSEAEGKALLPHHSRCNSMIELNSKTNETLEAMAQALFKSWFVDFDPVRSKAEGRPTGLPDEISNLFPDSFEDSELGKFARGWGV
jgi:type I restriction enzyme S subunit